MKTPADMLASDLRRMAGTIPVGWRAAVLMVLLIVLFPVLVTVLILDALTYDMPAVRVPLRNVMHWATAWMHFTPRRTTLHRPPRVRHAH
jgi:hypothetical protein